MLTARSLMQCGADSAAVTALSDSMEKNRNFLHCTKNATSIPMGTASNAVRKAFNDMVQRHGSLAMALRALLARQHTQKVHHCPVEIVEKYEDWMVSIPTNETALEMLDVLKDLDDYVTRNGFKDRSSGIEDLLFTDDDCMKFVQKSVSAVKCSESHDASAEKCDQSSSSAETLLVVVDTGDDSTEALFAPERIYDQESINCPLCNELLESKTLLQEHCRQDHLRHVSFTTEGDIKLSSNELSKCPQCDYVALRKGRMSTHLRNVHSVIEDIKCEICRKSFKSHRAMIHHFQQLHTMINSACDICGKVCKNRAAYQNHSLTHSRLFECKFCGKTFNNRRCYTQHEKRHLSTTVHLCNFCGQQFNLKSNLERHRRITHLKEGKLNCDSCTFSTFYKENLKEHVNKVHIGIKAGKFICHHCDKGFTRRVVYEEHMDKHEGRYRYSCQFCGRKFRNNARCKQHTVQCIVNRKSSQIVEANSIPETSAICVGDSVPEILPDPANLGLIVTMDFVQAADSE